MSEPCVVTMSIAGYRSVQVPLANDMIVHLKPLLPGEGSAVSFTEEGAPVEARKAYWDGLRYDSSHEAQKAQEKFETATALYPKYASVWLKLAENAERDGRYEDAARLYTKAQESDPRFLPAFVGAANLAVSRSDWTQALAQSEKAVRLNPVEFPKAYLFRTVAAFGLSNWVLAESAAKAALDHDPGHTFPLEEYILAVACDRQNRADDAATHFRLYLQQSPSGPHAAEASARVAALASLSHTPQQ